MKKGIISLSCIGLAFFVISSTGVTSQLVSFLIVGAVPGTTHTVAPLTMLLIFGSLSLLAVMYLFSGYIVSGAKHLKSVVEYLDTLESRF